MRTRCGALLGDVRLRGEAPRQEGGHGARERTEADAADARQQARPQRHLQGDHRTTEHCESPPTLPSMMTSRLAVCMNVCVACVKMETGWCVGVRFAIIAFIAAVIG